MVQVDPGDTIWWGQAMAEPLTLTRALVEHRHALAQGGRLRIFASYGVTPLFKKHAGPECHTFSFGISLLM